MDVPLDRDFKVPIEDPPPYAQSDPTRNSIYSRLEFRDGRIDGEIDPEVGRRITRVFNSLAPESLEPPPLPESQLPVSSKTCNIKLNIVIHVVGSRGDVQPFVALADGLIKDGHRVRLATHAVFEDFVKKSNPHIGFYPIGGDPSELMAYMVKNPGLLPSMKSLRAGDIPAKRKMIAEILDGAWLSCISRDPQTAEPFVADAIIANPPSFAHVHCAQALSCPVHMMFTMPWTSTKAFPHPLASLKGLSTDPGIANYLSYGAVQYMTWQGTGDIINKWRRHSLNLEPIPLTEGPSLLNTLQVPYTYCWSPSLLPKPGDWAANIDVCGFFFRDPPSYKPPVDLAGFLAAGPPPVYIGFGSIVLENPEEFLSNILAAVETLGIRAIISRGWSNLQGGENPKILYLGDCPHEWLFQHVSAVVHHGGAGTTACGLLNGKPTVIVPFFGDQPFWGKIVAAAGAGPLPVSPKELTSQSLADAISFCLTPEAVTAAQGLATKMRSESGVITAIKSFYANLPQQKMACDVLPDQAATWTYKRKKKTLSLSKKAAAILIDSREVEAKKLKQLEIKPLFIENRRWDPFTAMTSSAIATSTDILDDTAGIFYRPIQEIRKAHERKHAPVSEASSSSSQKEGQKRSSSGAGAAFGASGISSAKLMGHFTKGLVVDLPLAATEGLLNVPHLYGDRIRDNGKVTGVVSGLAVAGKTFGFGLYEGLTDIVTESYRLGKSEGALGVVKGFSKGALHMGTKPAAAGLGLFSYPAQGVYKSIHSAARRSTRKSIEDAKVAERQWLLSARPMSQAELLDFRNKYDELVNISWGG